MADAVKHGAGAVKDKVTGRWPNIWNYNQHTYM